MPRSGLEDGRERSCSCGFGVGDELSKSGLGLGVQNPTLMGWGGLPASGFGVGYGGLGGVSEMWGGRRL